ncbi:aminopeptidase N [Legionella hackeliae]|uniref:Aminopeptidase N n=1 Tax=Legionella hackeliae TaxID=449 RepID=A0A0A8UWW8_LEGHA|nr:aminopeptidase N [Legionella hackeliae]KTD12615.1 aminopeptidase [Legionella hackeliae]CEK12031.1 Aminopeptidase N [Legionella hackeliae]STX48816.1 aminopeptidase [Legionella hackeliae]
MPDTTIYLKNYQPPVFTVKNVDLNFDLYDDHALVTSQLELKRQHQGGLHLYGDELELVSIHINSRQLTESDYELREGDLLIKNCPDELTLKIVTRIRPQENTQLSGLYRSNHLFCTQCEAEGFRRITFFPDRPDVLAPFTTTITADKEKYPVLLSNGNLIDSGDLPAGRHWVKWQDPFKKPSYLFALVAGDLAHISDTFQTRSGKHVDLHVYVEPGNEDKCEHAMASLKRAMRWDEEMYGREYDLAIFMIVAVSDFNMGAMENKGLNIFNSKYILARSDTATDQDFADIEGVVGHEYFHNWTGNRVTCRDWFQLSLKEGLTVFRDQEFSRDMNSRDVNRIQDVKTLRSTQFPEDAGTMAHPVRPESYQEINNFYTATVYNKGAEVIRMQQTLLGKDGFRRGMDLYFERHDGQAVTIDDFVAAMEDANQVDLTQFKRWYSQAGTPEVRVSKHFRGDTLTITMTQSCPATPECTDKKPFHIPIRVALFDANGQKLAIEKDVLELREAEQTFSFTGLKGEPIVSLLRDFSAPIKLYSQASEKELLALLRFETDGFAKWDAAQRLALNCIQTYFNSPQQEWGIPDALLAAYRHVLLDESLDNALRAEILTPPSFEEVAASLTGVDVDNVEAARDYFRKTLGMYLIEEASSTYQRLWQIESHAMNAQAYGQRQLRNICLWLMMKADEKRSLSVCRQQFIKSRTMTDQMASFALLNNCTQESFREQSIDSFYQQWSQDELVLDKWFAIQASSELPDTLARVKTLLKHPAFNIKNPNKVRALIGAFCQSNPRNFHAKDGSGYAFLTEMIVKLDKINPQITARLATPFTRWRRYDLKRQELIKQELRQLASLELSRDLREVVAKSLVV